MYGYLISIIAKVYNCSRLDIADCMKIGLDFDLSTTTVSGVVSLTPLTTEQ